MSIFNPWGEVRELKARLVEAEKIYVELTKQIKELTFSKKENEREIEVLKATLAEARKNDTRDSTGRFTKAKK
jgi:predicted RNase H-like nuclease (RuvC/YqgF family)